MADVTFRSGEYRTIKHTPSSGNVSAGDVVLLGNTVGLTCGIAHKDITNNTLGSLAIGGGTYDVIPLGNYATGTTVFWDAGNSKVTTTSTNNALFGFMVETGVTNTSGQALHHPYAETDTDGS